MNQYKVPIMQTHLDFHTSPDISGVGSRFLKKNFQAALNAVNSELLKAAQEHPEEHRQLVVRIWGWSAYFVELDKEYQEHVLSR